MSVSFVNFFSPQGFSPCFSNSLSNNRFFSRLNSSIRSILKGVDWFCSFFDNKKGGLEAVNSVDLWLFCLMNNLTDRFKMKFQKWE